MPRSSLVHGALLLVTLIYGANYTIAKYALPEHLQPFAFISVRLAATTLLFWTVSTFSRGSKAVCRRDHGLLVMCAVFGTAANQLFFFQGLSMTTPIHASVIMTLSPIAVILAAALLKHERLTWRKAAGAAIGAVGAVLLLTKNGISLSAGTFLGDLFVILNACTYAFYLVLVKPLMNRYPPLTVLKWLFLYGLLLALPFGLRQLGDTAWSHITAIAWLSVGYVVLAATFGVYLLNIWALQYVNSSVVGIYIYLQPVFATGVALSLKEDTFEWLTLLYALIIFSGVYLVSSKREL